MNNIIYKKGDHIGNLLIVEEIPNLRNRKTFVFKCLCGCEFQELLSNIISGNVINCGCTPTLYYTKRVWNSIKRRCLGKGSSKNYKDKGIKICERWLNFENFLQDMGHRPSKYYSIDRIDSNKDYEPGNCRWATILQQNNNTSRIKYIELWGERKTYTQWAKLIGISVNLISSRDRKGYSSFNILSKDPLPNKNRKIIVKHSFGYVV